VLASLYELVSAWEQSGSRVLEELLASRKVSAASPNLHAAYLRLESHHDARVVRLLSDRMGLQPDEQLRLTLWVGFVNIASRAAVNLLAEASEAGPEVHPLEVYRTVLMASGLLTGASPASLALARMDPTCGGWLAGSAEGEPSRPPVTTGAGTAPEDPTPSLTA
jgi:hypothetical protein